jgi:peptidoglycan/xylan/chitin deacetylase (PgdA/CDA1 family)
MSRRTTGLIKAAFSMLHFSGADSMLSSMTGGVGVVFTLHNVRPERPDAFQPNRILSVTPQFLDTVVQFVVSRGFEVLSLDELAVRLTEGDFDRPFACFTFDDGYRDNREYAYPIFKRYGLPMAVYVPTDFADGRADLWWLKLEKVIAALSIVEVKMNGASARFETRSVQQKEVAFDQIYWWLRSIPEVEARATVADLCRLHDVDVASLCSDLVMGWNEVRDLASDPLVTIGAHTRRHFALAKLTRGEARLEIEESVRRLETELRRPCRHFSFPYGDASSAGPREFELVRELGLSTAVTTRKGLIHTSHAGALTSLPRLSLNGDFQKTRYVKTMLTGAPFALLKVAERLSLHRGDQREANL